MSTTVREKALTAIRLANRRYLQDVLQRNLPERHDDITALFERHMAAIADYCMGGYGGAGSLNVAFIRGLHKMLFPEGYAYRQEVDGKLRELVPGEYRDGQGAADSQLNPGAVVVFAPPEDVSAAMEGAVERLNAALSAAKSPKAKRDAVLWFIFDFSVIHPFGDANGRVMCMICDLLLIKEGLPPLHIAVIKEQHREDLYRAGEQAQRNRDLAPLYEVIERYNPAALA
jgi:Fic family protein